MGSVAWGGRSTRAPHPLPMYSRAYCICVSFERSSKAKPTQTVAADKTGPGCVTPHQPVVHPHNNRSCLKSRRSEDALCHQLLYPPCVIIRHIRVVESGGALPSRLIDVMQKIVFFKFHPTFTPGKTRYPLYRRLGGLRSRSG